VTPRAVVRGQPPLRSPSRDLDAIASRALCAVQGVVAGLDERRSVKGAVARGCDAHARREPDAVPGMRADLGDRVVPVSGIGRVPFDA